MKYIFPFLIVLICVSCADDDVKIPDDVIPKDKFTDILFEVEIVDAIHTQNPAGKQDQDLVTLGNYQQIFSDFDISEKDFSRSYSFYEEHPDIMLQIIDTLNNRFVVLEDSISQELNKAKWRRKNR